jgi:hypothetical protein
MHTELYSLSKIFTENLYRIPDYQRGYSWTTRQLKDFWSDLVLLDHGRDHYTGVLTLEEVTRNEYQKWQDDLWIIESKKYRPFYVVDGQQRLTTSLILLQVVLEQMKSDSSLHYWTADEIRKKYIFESRDRGISRSYIFGYEKDNPSYEFLKTRIFMEKSDHHETGEKTIYTHNLIAAKQFFLKKIEGMDITKLEQFYTKLTQHFLFNIYTIAPGIEVFVAFETMNNRGKPLSHLELLKNRLIFLSTRLINNDIEERSKVRFAVNESWKTAYHYLGRNQKKPLDDDLFLQTHFVSYVGEMLYDVRTHEVSRSRINMLIRDGEYKNYLLDELFTSRNIPRVAGNLAKEAGFDDDLAKNPPHPLSTNSIYDYARDIKDCVKTYYAILNPEDSDLTDDQKIVLAQITRLGWYDALPLGLIAAMMTKGQELTDLLIMLERYLFLRFAINYPQQLHVVNITELSVMIKKRILTIKDATSALNIYSEIYSPKTSVVDLFSQSYRHQGHYGWKVIRYFLFEYELELKKKARAKRDKISWDDFISEHFDEDYETVEHIYPQRPTADYWKTKFGHLTNRQRQLLRNSLGNLVALSRPKNAALGNRSFPEKTKGSATTSGYVAGSYSEIEVAHYEDWTPEAILERGLKMMTFMEKRWRFKLKDKDTKIQTLGLSFMVKSDDNEPEN